MMARLRSVGLGVGVMVLAGSAHAAGSPENLAAPEPERQPLPPAPPKREEPTRADAVKPVAADEAQRLSFVENAYGSSPRSVFAGLSGLAISNSDERAQLGVLLGGSPLERLTVHALVGRDGKGHFAPWLAVQYAFLGGLQQRYALGALAQYKAEGFTEAGGELEFGALFSVRPGRFHLDAAAFFGFGLEDEGEAKKPGQDDGEADAEGKLRVAYDIFGPLRAGAVGRFRRRVVGERSLAGGKSWDFIGGGELVASLGRARSRHPLAPLRWAWPTAWARTAC